MVEGVNLMLDTFGPIQLKTKPSQPATRGGTYRRRDTVKLYVLLSICMYSHRISAAVLYSMETGSLVSGLNTIMLEHGYRTKRLSFNAGSSLIPAAAATAEATAEQEADEEEDLSQENAALMRANLWEAGFTLRPVHSKTPWR
jgi:hypothetical protein